MAVTRAVRCARQHKFRGLLEYVYFGTGGQRFWREGGNYGVVEEGLTERMVWLRSDGALSLGFMFRGVVSWGCLLDRRLGVDAN